MGERPILATGKGGFLQPENHSLPCFFWGGLSPQVLWDEVRVEVPEGGDLGPGQVVLCLFWPSLSFLTSLQALGLVVREVRPVGSHPFRASKAGRRGVLPSPADGYAWFPRDPEAP